MTLKFLMNTRRYGWYLCKFWGIQSEWERENLNPFWWYDCLYAYPIVIELFIRGKKLNISLVFITQSYFNVPRNTRLNWTYCFVIKIQNQWELQLIAFNHSSDIDFKDFFKWMFCKTIIFFSHWCYFCIR